MFMLMMAGKAELERASLFSLKLLETALQKQESYLSALRQTGASTLGSRMDKLLPVSYTHLTLPTNREV